jgi:hypothetical protein
VRDYFEQQLTPRGWTIVSDREAAYPTGGTLIAAQRDGYRYEVLYEQIPGAAGQTRTTITVHVQKV